MGFGYPSLQMDVLGTRTRLRGGGPRVNEGMVGSGWIGTSMWQRVAGTKVEWEDVVRDRGGLWSEMGIAGIAVGIEEETTADARATLWSLPVPSERWLLTL